ncbi:peptidase M24, structural domain-containing protein [Gigaspora rosea]|uniref:Probable metalloprotease ARX1 n=1 Tax=Gigaspora rosea TaxID=44941 RepID=A0A397U7T9_9GLOM|nr:peptidase M24, structural domain-containing protein [Gigaspora rosea]
MEVEYYTQKFNTDNDLSNSVILSKYRSAADIVNAVLPQIISRIVPGASVSELCKYGDQLIFSHTSKVYNKNKVEKGVALPTMICVNHCLQYFSPLPENDIILQHGDLVKVELGVHIDGYIASTAHTTILNPNPQQPIEGRSADAVAAAHFGAEVALKLLKAGNKGSDIVKAVNQVADAFKCIPVEGSIVQQIRRYVLQAENSAILNPNDGFPDGDFIINSNEVYTINILMSTGNGLIRESDLKPTIYQRNVNEVYNLKLKAARTVFKKISDNYSVFPFSLNSLENTRDRLGIPECVTHGLLRPYYVLLENAGQAVVAQFKFTALVGTNGNATRITSSLQLPYVYSEFSIPPETDIGKLLANEIKSTKAKNI